MIDTRVHRAKRPGRSGMWLAMTVSHISFTQLGSAFAVDDPTEEM